MGYRSQVVLAIAPEAAAAFMVLQAKHPEVLALCNNADDFSSGYEQEGDWYMHWSDIKWYSEYEDVGALIHFIEALDSDDLSEYGEPESPSKRPGSESGWHEYFKFIRVGEDYDDFESKGWGFDSIFINRAIQF
jgi:hypothetical protein